MKIRTHNENYSFVENLESAIGKAKEAIGSISYPSYPNLNREAITMLENSIYTMETVLETAIFKP